MPYRFLSILVGAALVVGCAETSQAETVEVAGGSFERVGSSTFAELVDDPGVTTVNVHVPYDGEISGTDLFVPFDEVTTDERIPDETDSRLAIYCRSGVMSAQAAQALVAAGYSDIIELEGGMNSWQEDRSLLGRP